MTTELKNEKVTVSITRDKGCKVSLDVNVSTEATVAVYKKALKLINKEVSIPGFRKGHAPKAMIEKNYQKHLTREWHELLLQATLNEALDLTKIYPFDRENSVKSDIKTISQEEGSRVVFEFEAFPDVPEVNPNDIKIKKVKPQSMNDKDVDGFIHEMQHRQATWENIEGRPIEEGDHVDLDIENSETGEMLVENNRFEVAKGKMGEWMLKLLLGQEVGKTVEGLSERDKNLESEAEFKPTQCKITIHAIQKPTLPELNQEFFEKLGASDEKDLREKVLKHLESNAELEAREEMLEQLEKIVCEMYDFDIPESMLTAQKSAYQSRRSMNTSNEDQQAIEKEANTVIPKLLRFAFLTTAISKKKNLSVSDQEFTQELFQQMLARRMTMDNIDDAFKESVYANLIQKKGKEWLLDNATIV